MLNLYISLKPVTILFAKIKHPQILKLFESNDVGLRKLFVVLLKTIGATTHDRKVDVSTPYWPGNFVLASLDKMLHDNHSCLVESDW